MVALGKIAFDVYLDILKRRGVIASRSGFVFGHDCEFVTAPGQPRLVSSYHPSQQNTSTGKLTEAMLTAVFRRARRISKIHLAGPLRILRRKDHSLTQWWPARRKTLSRHVGIIQDGRRRISSTRRQ